MYWSCHNKQNKLYQDPPQKHKKSKKISKKPTKHILEYEPYDSYESYDEDYEIVDMKNYV